MHRLITSLVFVAACVQADLVLVENGEPRSAIVMSAEAAPATRLAATELQRVIAKMSGAQLEIRHTLSPTMDLQIFVGASAHTEHLGIQVEDLEHGAYRLASGDGWLLLAGRDRQFVPAEAIPRKHNDMERAEQAWDELSGGHYGMPYTQIYKQYSPALDLWEQDETGSFSAVTDVLRRLGCRWYLPDPMGEIIPQRATIVLPELHETVDPDFAVRRAYQYYRQYGATETATRDEILWQLRLGLNHGAAIAGRRHPVHGVDYVHSREEVKQAHPEYFLMVNGERDIRAKGAGRPCLSSPGLRADNVHMLRKIFDVFDERGFSVQPADGYGTLCECELCTGKATPERGWYGQLSDYVWTYINDVATEVYQTHPDRHIIAFAYTSFRLPPTTIEQLSPNIILGIAQSRARYVDEVKWQEAQELRQAWLAKLPEDGKLMMGDYYLHAAPRSVYYRLPVYFPHAIAKDLQSLKGRSVGDFIEVYRNWGLIDLAVCHLNLYVTARYWWDADQDIESLLEEYYTLFYGPAREQMKAFITYSEQHVDAMRKEGDKIERALELLDAARQAAPAGTIYAQRIDLVNEFVQPMRGRLEQLGKGRENPLVVRTSWGPPADITLDGKLDDPFWAGVQKHRLKDIVSGDRPVHEGWFHVIWGSDKAMYFGIDLQDEGPLAITGSTHDDPALWNGDAVEILIETQLNSYYQIAINPDGLVIDLDRKEGFGMLWTSGAEVATHKRDDGWSIEVRIPTVDELQYEVDGINGLAGYRPSSTYPWFFNVCRQRLRGDDIQLTAYSPTGERQFHNILKFAELHCR